MEDHRGTNKAPDSQRPGGDEATNGIEAHWSSGKDSEQTKAFLNALGYMQIIIMHYCKTIAINDFEY